MMKHRTIKKLTRVAAGIYSLDIIDTLGGVGGCPIITQHQRGKLAKMRKFLYRHPNYQEWSDMMLDKLNEAWYNASH